MSRDAVMWNVAVVLLLGTGLLLAVSRDPDEVALAAPLETIPSELPGWKGSNDVPVDVLPIDGNAPVRFLRTYQNGTQTVWVSVDYYGSQREGHRPPALALLYPGRGWSELTARVVRVPLPDRRDSIDANLLLMRVAGRRVAILYWYEVQGMRVTSDHWYRALLVYSRLVRGRTDGALMRVASPVTEGVDPASVVAKQASFLRDFYPEVTRRLPR
jgi:EpsI family protein